MKILSSLLLIVGVIVCVQIVHAYGATTVTLRIFNINTASAIIGNSGLTNGMYCVYADVKDCDPADSEQGTFANQNITAWAFESGPLLAKGIAHCFVQGHDQWNNFQRDDDSDDN